jgi:hypothetical protein
MGSEGSDRERKSERIGTSALKSMKGTTRAGIRFCYIIIGLIGLLSLIMVIYFFAATHSLRPLAQPLTQESLQIYKEARSTVVDDITRIGDQLLGNVLLPTLTLLLGYIFGSREEKA